MKIAVKQNIFSPALKITNIETMMKMMNSGYFNEQIEAIRNESDKKTRGKLKESLPQIFMFEPIDLEAGSTVMNVKAHNGMFIFDIDIYDMFDEIKEQVFKKLGSKIIFAFKSPSGGLKFAIRSKDPIHDDEEYKRVYKILIAQFKKLGIECEVDAQTCNINRGTYVSDNSFVYVNMNAGVIDTAKALAKARADIAEDMKVFDIQAKHQESAKRDEAKAMRYRAVAVKNILNSIGPGNRHNSIFQLGMVIYSTGGSIYDCTSELEMLRISGQYSENMTPAKKAQDIHKYWVRKGAKLHESCFAMTFAEKGALLLAIGNS